MPHKLCIFDDDCIKSNIKDIIFVYELLSWYVVIETTSLLNTSINIIKN